MALASSLPPLSLLFLFLTLGISGVHSSPTLSPSAAMQSLAQKRKPAMDAKLPFTAHFFPQQLDHFTFRPKAYHVFYQKYLINSTYWDQGPVHTAPIFVYTGNEGNIEWFAANTGFMLDIAPKFKALLVFIEDESINCFEVIKHSWDELMAVGAKKGGMLELTKTFRACK
ncbi:hypothetical protein B296_00037613 [Ensete ventricosum]|uniref:Uncharacterized protein n=1 Tax=Ensete ventricosum TaxID=4639 RepID=A0A426Z7X5_ENSVE|nr:hypothetical protein B296_00037613 [Ensete ventricosum]